MPRLYPKWMTYALLLAGTYNLAWGLAVVLFPTTTFQYSGLAKPGVPLDYVQLWQCIGMIVGVYGVGYALAATDPVRHWPVVLVGFLGKIFGPLGYVWGVVNGETPAGLLRTIVFNDLVWWVPFALILTRAYRVFKDESAAPPAKPLPVALAAYISDAGATLAGLSAAGPTLVVFLRHLGCTYCREAAADLGAQLPRLTAGGVTVAVVHMGTPDQGAAMAATYHLPGVHLFSDPECRLYRAFGLGRGSYRQLFGPKAVARFPEAGVRAGHGVGPVVGDGFRMPGVFLLVDGEIAGAFRHDSVADRPDYCAVAGCGTPAPTPTGVPA